ncbi:MAG: sulfotransferase [Myxococcota bacterium]
MARRFPTVEELMEQARREAGLAEFGPPTFVPPLTALVESLEHEADLNAVGVGLQRTRLVELLKNRLRLQALLTRHPEIEDEEIVPPVMILGLPRTGTTMLQRLLSTDPRFIPTRWYEVRFPVPDPDWDFDEAHDARIPRAQAEVAAMIAADPEVLAIHPLDALAPDEDLMLLENAFLSSVPGSQANLPGYNAFYEQDDGRISTREHRRMLQLLQWQRRRAGNAVDGKPWLLKAPAHMFIFEAMRATYPGARFILSHRDPLACIPSISSLYQSFWRVASDSADPAECGRYTAHYYGAALERTIAAAREEPARFLDLEYEDLMKRQDEALERIYAFLDWPIEPETRAGFARWRAENPRDRRKPHHYRIEDFGLTRAGLAGAYATYRSSRGYDRGDPEQRGAR